MDERTWVKARSLADRFSSEFDEDVAVVLGEALLEALAGLLVPEEDVMEAKAQHPAYLPSTEDGRLDQGHPEFLEGEKAYASAPEGTQTDVSVDGDRAGTKQSDGHWIGSDGRGSIPNTRRRVLRWGYGTVPS